ncbi:hypothetical protein [Pedobacter rhodius]|uniref:Uncharacterized protein n=1 Tax=Pedobacter rhodius TaxID=3004098 RepID=A0ABT4L2V0_9SPHI|nr:hypothetical protein [Pedobacter sp. SJ11]MCZ4225515.1 hypothetical protein [Pedobacter sp. SJ11]
MNTNPDTQHPENSGNLKAGENDDNWDNDTYGHITDPDAIKKKNEPQHEGNENIDASEKLKNENIIADDDVAARNKNEDKGVGGQMQ